MEVQAINFEGTKVLKKILTLLGKEDDVFGINYQDHSSCGAFAVMHAALCFGIPITSGQASKLLGVSRKRAIWYGANEDAIKKALSKLNLEATFYSFTDESSLKKKLDSILDQGSVAVISCEEESHWAVIPARNSHHEYYYIDSADPSLIGISDFHQISEWMEYYNDDEESEYFFMQVRPKDEKHMKLCINGCIGKILKLNGADSECVSYWGFYLYHLLDVFNCPDSKDLITASEFFSKYRKPLQETVSKIEDSESDLMWELQCLETVAVTHNLTLSRSNELLYSPT
jgi:hypothetical protein